MREHDEHKSKDGIVTGTSDNDRIDMSYTGDPQGDRIDHGDAVLPGAGPDDDVVDALGGDDTIHAGAGDDLVHAGAGDDSVSGGTGNDTLIGDGNAPGGTHGREVFQWDELADPDNGGEIDDGDMLNDPVQLNTGSVTVSYRVLHGVDEAKTEFSEDHQYVEGIDSDGEPVDGESSLGSTLYAEGASAGYELSFSDEVANVSFRINDIDGDGIVRIKAFDSEGNPVEVDLTGGKRLTLKDTDGVPGADTADSKGGYAPDDSRFYSLLVEIPGPVSRLVIEHEQDGDNNTGINVTDIYYDVPPFDMEEDGDDTLDGGDGDDVIIGGGGNDSVTGGDGNDVIDTSGGKPLPDRGFPSYDGLPPVPADPMPDNDHDTVDGGAGDDLIMTGDDADAIAGGAGSDTILAGLDDDTVDGGSGADRIVGGEGADSIQGGAGDDTIYGGLDPVFPDALNIPDDGSAGAPDPDPTNGTDSIDGGAGNDVIFGQDDDDTITGGDGDDSLDGGIDDDDVRGDAGNDTVLGGQGDDTVFGGTGTDNVSGGAGDDIVFGGLDSDADLVDGGDGADILGALENDTVAGGEGGPVDFDRLLVRGPATVRWDNDDPGTEAGYVTYYDENLNVVGTARFTEIEQVHAIDTQGVAPTSADAPDQNAVHGIVEGTNHDDLIDVNYTGDPEGDMIDHGDAVRPLTGNQDVVLAGNGDDTVMSGLDSDLVFGGQGDDELHGEEGSDALAGEEGDDVLDGGQGADLMVGGSGDDTLSGSNATAGDEGDAMFGGTGDDRFVEISQGDTIHGGEDPDGGDNDVLDLTGAAEVASPGGRLYVEYDPGNPESGVVHFLDADGNETGTAEFSEIETVIPCFTPGTLIATPQGERRVEDLQVGDRVITRDNGIQAIRWIGQRTLSGAELARSPKFQPILIRAGALGQGLPERDMLVSPNHRVLMCNERTSLYFDDSEVLVAAKHLTGMEGIDQVEVDEVTYVHFMFDRHEVVLSDGAWTESFQPGEWTLDGMEQEQRQELFELFPELQEREGVEAFPAARRTLKKHEARLLIH